MKSKKKQTGGVTPNPVNNPQGLANVTEDFISGPSSTDLNQEENEAEKMRLGGYFSKERRDERKTIRKAKRADIKAARQKAKDAKAEAKAQRNKGKVKSAPTKKPAVIKSNVNVAADNARKNQKVAEENKPATDLKTIKTKPVKIAKQESFGSAFKRARKAHGGGGGIFTYKGKKYSTDTAEDNEKQSKEQSNRVKENKKMVEESKKKRNNQKINIKKKTDNKGSNSTKAALIARPNVPQPKKGNGQLNQGTKIKTPTGGKKGAYQFKTGGFSTTKIVNPFD